MLIIKSRQAIMGEMLEMIAHQWKQPLSSISTVSTSIKFKNELGILKEDEIQKSMETITITVEHLSKTVDEFRDFLKIKTKKMNFQLIEHLKKFSN